MVYLACPEKSLLWDSSLCEHSNFSRETRQAQGCPEHCKQDSAAAAAFEGEAPAARMSRGQGSLRYAHKSIFLVGQIDMPRQGARPLPPLRGKVAGGAGRMRGRATRRVASALTGCGRLYCLGSLRIVDIPNNAPYGATPHPSRFARHLPPQGGKGAPVLKCVHTVVKEVGKLVEGARSRGRHGRRDATMILVAHWHGLRASELCALRWDQVDPERGLVHVGRLENGTPARRHASSSRGRARPGDGTPGLDHGAGGARRGVETERRRRGPFIAAAEINDSSWPPPGQARGVPAIHAAKPRLARRKAAHFPPLPEEGNQLCRVDGRDTPGPDPGAAMTAVSIFGDWHHSSEPRLGGGEIFAGVEVGEGVLAADRREEDAGPRRAAP